jgi:hypothetical protein
LQEVGGNAGPERNGRPARLAAVRQNPAYRPAPVHFEAASEIRESLKPLFAVSRRETLESSGGFD